jgi:hypothetical protein
MQMNQKNWIGSPKIAMGNIRDKVRALMAADNSSGDWVFSLIWTASREARYTLILTSGVVMTVDIATYIRFGIILAAG